MAQTTFGWEPISRDQGDALVKGIARQNLLLSQMVSASAQATPVATLREIHEIVAAGEAAHVFAIGDQIMLNYNDGTNNFVLPWDIVHFETVTLEDGETIPGMVIQSHYAMEACQFDGNEAFYVVAGAAMPAGKYYFTMGNSWGNHVVSGKSYWFELPTAVPVGGMLVLGQANSTTSGLPDNAPSKWRVLVYESQTTTTIRERLTLTEGTDGTFLGTLSSSTKYDAGDLNNMQRSGYGYGRWSQSGIRQRLNSAQAAGAWWNPQNTYDRPPDQLETLRGFMDGFDEEFLNIIKPVRVRTALNTTSDSEIGAYEDTFDTFFLASLEQEYAAPQAAGVEGDYWEYWKRRLGVTSPQGWYADHTNPNHIRYAYENHASAQYCRLRSAYRGYAYGAWLVTSAGNVNYIYAAYAFRCAPACVIC